MNKKSYENMLFYYISYKTLVGAKPLPTRFNKEDAFLRVYEGTRYLALFGLEKYHTI